MKSIEKLTLATVLVLAIGTTPAIADGGGLPPTKKPNGPRIIRGTAPTLIADGGGLPPIKPKTRSSSNVSDSDS